MERRYSHLTIEDRCAVARRHAAGASIRQIAASLDRAPSTIARELSRNGSRTQGYQPRYADQQARARRWRGPRLDRDPTLRRQVLTRLQQGWSPEQVAGRLAREAGRPVISHESIYRFIDAQIRRTKDYAWRHYLPRAKFKRGRRGRKGGSSASFIAHRRPLVDRPALAADRQTPGHWEADLMLFRTYGQAVLTLHERHSRLLLAVRPPAKPLPPSPAPCPGSSHPYRPPGAKPSPSTTAPSSPATTSCTPAASRPSSATPTPPGRRAASRTPSGACAAPCPARPISRASRPLGSPSSCRPTTTRHASASATRPPPRCFGIICCTWNVNPPSRVRGNDGTKVAASALCSTGPAAMLKDGGPMSIDA